MKILHLPLKAKWYKMIESGVKLEEYREIKPYWIKRFFRHFDGSKISKKNAEYLARNLSVLFSAVYVGTIRYVKYTHVKFSYGCTKRTMTFEIEGITIGNGKPEWGAPAEIVFIIKLGKRI